MKLLLDQNLSRRLIPELEFHYPKSTQVALIGLEKGSDIEIWNYAKENGFVIVTKDSDFEELSVLKGCPPKVIWIKLGNTQNEKIISALVSNIQNIEENLHQENVSCLEIYE